MILTGPEIARQVSLGRIELSPFEEQNINPNSYNVHLGPTITRYKEKVLDSAYPNPTYEEEIPSEGLLIQPDQLYLGSIAERIGSNHYVPIIKGRSSVARLGLFIVITADLVDQGAFGNWTLQLHAVQPMRIYAGMPIAQITFWCVDGRPMLYSGKYQGSSGPVASKSWQDAFFAEKS